jgi:hypothetical protein
MEASQSITNHHDHERSRLMPRKATGDQPHRSNYGTWKKQTRDDDGLRLVAEQKFVRLDTLCQWFAPGYTRATSLYPPDKQPKEQHGGNRAESGWPSDQRHRMMAVHRIVNKWCNVMKMAEKWQPWGDEPPWVRLNAAGLAEIGHADWPEIPWPEEKDKGRLRDNGDDHLSHTHRINEARLALARGDIKDIPAQHTWHSEREIEIGLPEKIKGVKLPHKPDGYIELGVTASWEMPTRGPISQVYTLPRGSRVGIEIELSRKNFEAYGSHYLPELLRLYDGAVYLAYGDAYDAVVAARQALLSSNDDRKRIRILKLTPAR